MNRFIPSAPSLGLASLMAVVTLGLSSAAQAALVSADFRKPGDGLLTRDTRTGLEWLDLSQTQRYTYAQLAGGAGGFIEKGRFQFASASQVENLLKSARLEPSPFPASAQVSGDAVGSSIPMWKLLARADHFRSGRCCLPEGGSVSLSQSQRRVYLCPPSWCGAPKLAQWSVRNDPAQCRKIPVPSGLIFPKDWQVGF
jgi:hypothetical protein